MLCRKYVGNFYEIFCSQAKNLCYLCIVKTTTRHIEYLSQIHDCVIITGLGAILAHNEQARMLDGVMHAPRRVYTFNDALTVSDGILEESIAREQQVDMVAAQQIIEDDVRKMLANLNADGHTSLGLLGSLYRDKATQSLALSASNSSLSSSLWSWLPEVPADDYIIQIDNDEAKGESEQRTKPQISIRHYLAKATRYAAAAIVLLVIGFAASTPINVDKSTQFASLAPTVNKPQKVVENKDVTEEFVYTPSTKCPTIVLCYQDVPTDTETEKGVKDIAKPETAPVGNANNGKADKQQSVKTLSNDHRLVDSDSFCVIIASLTNAEDAEKCIDEGLRKGRAYAVLQQGSRYRVYVATAPTKAQAQATLNSLASKYPGAWICQR